MLFFIKKVCYTVYRVGDFMKKNSKKQGRSNKFLYLLIVIVAFTLAFIVLINRQNKDTYYLNMTESNFSVTPKEGETIVARDGKAIYPKYYVVYVNNDEYSIYVFNYYETVSQYNLEFNRLLDSIVDYNAKDKMIRYLHSRGYGTYLEVLNNLSSLVDCDNLMFY